jgi:preprotein translocase subunit SecD
VRNVTWFRRSVVASFLTFLACSTSGDRSDVKPDWSRVPVSIELRLAQGAAGPGLVRAPVYEAGKTVYLYPQVELSNRDIARVEATQTRIGKGLILDVWHTKAGAERMARLTAQHVGDSLAVLIDSVVVAVPSIQEKIDPGTRTPSSIGVPLEPKEAGQLQKAVSQTWPRKGGT